jgi:hypothetical protein
MAVYLSVMGPAERDAGARVIAGPDVVGDEIGRGAAADAAVPVAVEDGLAERVLGLAVAVGAPAGVGWSGVLGAGCEPVARRLGTDLDALHVDLARLDAY